jgi:hypothetical protein
VNIPDSFKSSPTISPSKKAGQDAAEVEVTEEMIDEQIAEIRKSEVKIRDQINRISQQYQR